MDFSTTDHVAIFAQHVPTEFERKTHYLVDADGGSRLSHTDSGSSADHKRI